MSGKRRSFSREFKLEAISLVTEGGLSVAQAARDLGISESVLGRWKSQLAGDPEEAFPGKGHLKSQDEELRQLRRENALLRMERDILKKYHVGRPVLGWRLHNQPLPGGPIWQDPIYQGCGIS